MKPRNKLMMTAVVTAALASAAVGSPAQAASVNSPYGNNGVSVTVGTHAQFGPIVCFTRTSDARINTAYSLGTKAGGLNDNWTVGSGGGLDIVVVISSGIRNVCRSQANPAGYDLGPLEYGSGGRRLDVTTRGGKDIIVCGAGKSDCFGDQGDDEIEAFSAVGKISGGSGKDWMVGRSSNAGDRLSGGSGTDCLEDPGDQHLLFDCGSDPDKYVKPGSGRISCETSVTFCSNPP